MSIVTERLNANKPAPPQENLKAGKLAPGTVNNNKDLDVDIKKEEPSFFGSFFSAAKGAKKKGGPVMEAVSRSGIGSSETCLTFLTASGDHPSPSCSQRTRNDGDRCHQ